MTKETTFKVGDKVEFIVNYSLSCQKGTKATVTEVDVDIITGVTDTENGFSCWPSRLKHIEKTWDTLEAGDMITTANIEPREVYDVLPNTVIFRSHNGETIIRTKKWLQGAGWTIKGAEEDTPTELTLEEIAKRFNVPVDKLRIKD
jgi:hypothetical protein